jgi:hypothetical protein
MTVSCRIQFWRFHGGEDIRGSVGFLRRIVWRLDPNVSEDHAGSTVLWNVGIQPPHYTAQQHRKARIQFHNLFFSIFHQDYFC